MTYAFLLVWFDRLINLFLAACVLAWVVLVISAACAVISGVCRWISRAIRRGGIREKADHVHRDWEEWHRTHDGPRDGSRLSDHPAAEKRVKAQGDRR